MHGNVAIRRALWSFAARCMNTTLLLPTVGVSSIILVIPTGGSPLVLLLVPVQNSLQLEQRTDQSVNVCTRLSCLGMHCDTMMYRDTLMYHDML